MKNKIESIKRSTDKIASAKVLFDAGLIRRSIVGINDSDSVTTWRVKPRYGYGGRGHIEVTGSLDNVVIHDCDYIVEERIDIVAEYRVYVGCKRGESHTVFHVDKKLAHQENESIGLRNNFYFSSCSGMMTKFAGVREAGIGAAVAIDLNMAAVDVAVYRDSEGYFVEVIETNTKPAITRGGLRAKWNEYKNGWRILRNWKARVNSCAFSYLIINEVFIKSE